MLMLPTNALCTFKKEAVTPISDLYAVGTCSRVMDRLGESDILHSRPPRHCNYMAPPDYPTRADVIVQYFLQHMQ